MAIKSNWIITHDNVTYPSGEVIFDLPEKLQAEYVANGLATEVDVVYTPTPLDPPSDSQQGEDDDFLLTPEEFSQLSAADQKKELKDIGLEPETNAEARIAQYTEWYEQQGEDDEKL